MARSQLFFFFLLAAFFAFMILGCSVSHARQAPAAVDVKEAAIGEVYREGLQALTSMLPRGLVTPSAPIDGGN
ncbi:hypothetical protein KSP39_PZI013080 [Platanthera zijinensis]|uniref:Uncharacterized protein n=1 Tax=Platanthera zijinensis TaxID=2320716 RepID=A0AAP0BCP3_9ASPA